jgi:TPR repeat protein
MKKCFAIITLTFAIGVMLVSSGFASSVTTALKAYDDGDYNAASTIFEGLASRGDAAAQNELGYLYAQGHGVKQDYIRAHMWFNISAALGHVWAADNRDSVQVRMTPAQIKQAERLATTCVRKKFKGC